MRIISIILVALLAGCASTDPLAPQVVVQTEYVVRKAPNELKQVPAVPTIPDPAVATQLDLAQWIVSMELHARELQAKIAELVKFYEEPVEVKK